MVFILAFAAWSGFHALIHGPAKADDGQFKCLSVWDGSDRPLVDLVKSQLRDPDSFAHVETMISKPDSGGKQSISMTYRARNGFGGMNVATAHATIYHTSCSLRLEEGYSIE